MFSYNIIVLFLSLYHFTFIFQIIYWFHGNSGMTDVIYNIIEKLILQGENKRID